MLWTVYLEGGPRRVNHAAVCVDNNIYSFGGYTSTEEYKDWDPIPVHVLDTLTLRWTPVDYLGDDAPTAQSAPFQRYGHTTVAYGDKVYMWGGRNNAMACDTLSCFDTTTGKWTMPSVKGQRPFAKDGHSACVIGNMMYLFGGFEYLSDQYTDEVHCLDITSMTWRFVDAKGTLPPHRDFHTAVAIGKRMYVFGGRSDLEDREEIYCPKLYYLDTETDVWHSVDAGGTIPSGRRSHSAWVYEGEMYIFGGFNGNLKEHYNDLYKYSPLENTWTKLNNIPGRGPCKRRRQACIMNEDKMYLFGGTCQCLASMINQFSDDLEKLLDNNDLYVLDFKPTLKTLGILAVFKYNLDTSSLPRHIKTDMQWMTVHNRISRSVSQSG